jgi:hypothetical protein
MVVVRFTVNLIGQQAQAGWVSWSDVLEFDACDDGLRGDCHVVAKHLHELAAGVVWESFQDGFLVAVFRICGEAVQGLGNGTDDFDCAQADDVLSGAQSHAFAATHEAITRLEKFPTEATGDRLGFG